MNLYDVKQKAYFTNIRTDLVSLLPSNPSNKVLEIGAGGGDTLVFIKENNLAEIVYGLDIFELKNTKQNDPKIDKFFIADIEKDSVDLPINYFDAILCGDVIEHLIDPWAVIKKVSNYLKPGGLIIINTPNFRHWKNFKSIFIDGDFLYNPEGGLLDKTHLRFFCKKNIASLVQTEEISFKSIHSINEFAQFRHSARMRLVHLLTFSAFEQFVASQYVVVGTRRTTL